MDLHPYDNVERRFRHTDPAPGVGRDIAARVLRLTALPAGELLFDLSFFSGGIGVLDNLAVSLTADSALWLTVVTALHGHSPEEAEANQEWAQELIWLFTNEEEAVSLRPAAIAFINQHRREFQPECDPSNRISIGRDSDINSWLVLWGDGNRLNYLRYDQG